MALAAVAKRYAEALADVTMNAGAAPGIEKAAEELRRFEQALRSSPELREALATPAIPPGKKKAVVSRIAEALGISRLTRNFLLVLADHRRIGALSEIVAAFETASDERLGFSRAEVTAAREMSQAQRAALGSALEKLTGRTVRMRVALDEGLIGGAIARIGSTIYDGSVRGQLAALERRLSGEN